VTPTSVSLLNRLEAAVTNAFDWSCCMPSINAVVLAKSRVLKRLREEAGDLLE
jgi:hypothetical protein